MAYWSSLASHDSIPLASQINPIEMRGALGHVMLLEVVDGGRDFRYRVFGTEIAAVSEFDMTGRLLSEHQATPISWNLHSPSIELHSSAVALS